MCLSAPLRQLLHLNAIPGEIVTKLQSLPEIVDSALGEA